MGLSTSLRIWQFYINAIFSSITDRSKYLAPMDELLLHSSKPGHLKYLQNLLKVLLKSSLKISPKKCHSFKLNYNICVTIFYQRQESVVNY